MSESLRTTVRNIGAVAVLAGALGIAFASSCGERLDVDECTDARAPFALLGVLAIIGGLIAVAQAWDDGRKARRRADREELARLETEVEADGG